MCAMFGGGMFSVLGLAKDITLNDAAGVDTFTIKDSDGFTLFKIDSSGDLHLKGQVKRV